MPFNLTAPQQQLASHSSPQQLRQTSQADQQISSSQTGAPTVGWQGPPLAGLASDAEGSAAFRLLPSAMFEQLSDPNRLTGSSSSSQASSTAWAGTPAGPVHGRLAWQKLEQGFNAQLEKMQQKPVWHPPDSGDGLSCHTSPVDMFTTWLSRLFDDRMH